MRFSAPSQRSPPLGARAAMHLRAEGIERFQSTGGLPPEGVKFLGNGTRADFGGGFDLLETDGTKKLLEFAYVWGDLMD